MGRKEQGQPVGQPIRHPSNPLNIESEAVSPLRK